MNLLFIGDIFGKPGRKIIIDHLEETKKEFSTDVCIANCENAASGKGITEKIFHQLREAGVDAFTSGNHLWDVKTSISFIEKENRICRPLNYPKKSVGATHCVLTVNSHPIVIITLIGQAFMGACNLPTETFDQWHQTFLDISSTIIVDFHAEATAEKKAMAYYLDGRVSAILGTHTHVQTADEQILPLGTGFITDVGMTGPHDSVIGVDKEIILEKFSSGIPKRYEVAKDGLELNAVSLTIDECTGKTTEIQRIKRKF